MLATDSVARNLASGGQTQDRRPLKVQPAFDGDLWAWRGESYNECDLLAAVAESDPVKVGDLFYVRETHRFTAWTFDDNGNVWSEYRATPGKRYGFAIPDDVCGESWIENTCLRTARRLPSFDEIDDGTYDGQCDFDVNELPWRPSIHQPKWAARTWLKVTRVWAERIQSISEADARAEGCDGDCPIGYIPAHQAGPFSYRFAQLWESLYPGSWERNDVVRCREFVKAPAP